MPKALATGAGTSPGAEVAAFDTLLFLLGLCVVDALVACRPDMMNQPKAKPLSEKRFFLHRANARPIPPHTVERGDARENAAFYTGLTNGIYVTQLPVKLTPELLAAAANATKSVRNATTAPARQRHDRAAGIPARRLIILIACAMRRSDIFST